MTKIITAQKIDDKNYDLYLNGWLGDQLYEDTYFGRLVFKFGTWVLVQNTHQGTNEEIDYQTDDLDEVLWAIDCEVMDCDNLEVFNDFLDLQ